MVEQLRAETVSGRLPHRTAASLLTLLGASVVGRRRSAFEQRQ
ncbi:protein of unknown function (plasmid) [Cupriavidus taiwanensis]|nr:protein of unknown function [Cupriavidus taiwanensis]SOZ72157.1 protein of unknown function [Cupriavidus taiwanensis]SOZ74454.1 protein of unknown function [Cupriavidus taiwanensis]SPA11375.1 protein of unknown function [Cupriavidus taiwanensis]